MIQLDEIPNLKEISDSEAEGLCARLRARIIDAVSRTGGHLASNLGTVEITVALHRVFDTGRDRVVFDVGHQCYSHKILTGRDTAMDTLRTFGGIAGYPKPQESQDDAFIAGHASNSVSVALGMARARSQRGEDYHVIALIGDGALTGGLAYEGLSNAGLSGEPLLVILNDNGMSITKNVGGVAQHLAHQRLKPQYLQFKKGYRKMMSVLPGGPQIYRVTHKIKTAIKETLLPCSMFEDMGFIYLGPVDGHNISQLCKVFREAKKLDHAVLVHVLTKKGKGYKPAEKNPSRFHGVDPFDVTTGKSLKEKQYPSYTEVFSRKLCQLAKERPNLVALTAAMPDGTGLSDFARHYPGRFFDVGIAEAHAVTSAAGMAAAGLKPVVAVYSSFLQRAYDQVLHDVCIQDLPVVFAVDRAGLVGSDGETHQGIFDYSFLTSIPNMSVMAPKNLWELRAMLEFSMDYNRPLAIRYPRGEAYRGLRDFREPIVYGKGEMLYEEEGIALLAVGSMVSTAEHIRQKLKAEGRSCTLANGRFVKPFDRELVDRLAERHKVIVTLEENVLQGGYGLPVTAYIHEHYPHRRVLNIGIPDAYVEHGNVSVLREGLGIDSDSIIKTMKSRGYLD